MRRSLIFRTRLAGVAAALVASLVLILVPLQLAFAGPLQALAPVTDADGRLGLCDVLAGSPSAASGPTWAQLAYNAGARINRWEFRWDKMEPVQGIWDFSANDAVVQSDLSTGLETEGILIGTPDWAVRAGQNPGNGLPRGLRLPITDPNNLWADYVRQTVHHYVGQVGYWEIWNEPDLKFFWTSTAGDYYQMLKVSYQVIKATDPQAKVVIAGMVAPDLGFVSEVLQAASQDPTSRATGGYFDIAAWHAYGAARDLYANLLHFQALLGKYGHADSPVWVTEDGFPASNPNGEPRQAAYVVQTIAYAMAAGAERVLVYRSSDDPIPKNWGIMSAQGVPRMAYTAFGVAAQFFSRVTAITYDPTSALEQFSLYSPTTRVTLLWNHGLTDRQTSLSAGLPTAKLVDWQGTATQLQATNGQFRLTAPGASYNKGPDPVSSVVGGPPILLIQNNARPAGLRGPTYIPPVSGSNRSLVLLNDGTTSEPVEIGIPGNMRERAELQMAPHSVQYVDLDLLGGPDYSGLYSVAATSSVAAQAISGPSAIGDIAPAMSWSVASAPPVLTLADTPAKTATAWITVFGAGGKVRARTTLQLDPLNPVQWALPGRLRGQQVSVDVQASRPIVVAGPAGPLANAVSQPQKTWYTVTPRTNRLSVFNPDPTLAAHVDVHFVGSKTVRGEQLRLAGHRSYSFPLHRARAVIVSATRGVALGYANAAQSGPPFATQSATRTALTAGGSSTHVSLFNPSVQPAHITVSLVDRTGTRHLTKVVQPSSVYSLQARQSAQPPRGVVVSSDVPVVTTLGD